MHIRKETEPHILHPVTEEYELNQEEIEKMETGRQIIETALNHGADLAGIASVNELKRSASHLIYPRMEDYRGVGTVQKEEALPADQLFNWPGTAKSALVIGISHPKDRPELDWWDGKGTPGNRALMGIIKKAAPDIENRFSVTTHKLHYYVEKGGVFLKDAATLAGLGTIGKGNMLVTPEFGPRVRLRALFLDAELEPTGPVDFDPCKDCKEYCRKVCPEHAMDEPASAFRSMDADFELPARDGSYDRELCNTRMEKDISESRQNGSDGQAPVKYCRKCEFVCPVGS
ncbi:MAG: 4Fe-4S double cluster binding domain-containing protein [Desulfobacteraceae bacterium]